MADRSAIEWTDATWNPIRARNRKTGKVGWHCEHATTGCINCYAEGFNRRLGTGLDFKPGHLDSGDIELFFDEEMLLHPLRWKKPRMIFVCSMTDLFARFVKDEWIDKIFAVMALSPQHTFQVLTKRADRMRSHIGADDFHIEVADRAFELWSTQLAPANSGSLSFVYRRDEEDCKDVDFNLTWPLPNVWLGVSAERQTEAEARIPLLLKTEAAVRFLSAEPLLDSIDLMGLINRPHNTLIIDALQGGIGYNAGPDGEGRIQWEGFKPSAKLDWIIVGGESGAVARPMEPGWAQSLRDQCDLHGTPFFFKQWGHHKPIPLYDNHQLTRSKFYLDGRGYSFHQIQGYALVAVGKKGSGRKLDGVEHNAMPARSTP